MRGCLLNDLCIESSSGLWDPSKSETEHAPYSTRGQMAISHLWFPQIRRIVDLDTPTRVHASHREDVRFTKLRYLAEDMVTVMKDV